VDILINNLKGRDPEKDCSHRPHKIREVGGFDRPPLTHRPGFTGKMRTIIKDGKAVEYEQVHQNGVLEWVNIS
jgi:hypothetical protein